MDDLIALFHRQRRPMMVAWGAMLAAGALGVFLMPDVFRSEAKLLVRLGRENVMLDPTANLGQGPISNVPQSRETELNSVVETLKSRGLLEKVVDEMTPAAILDSESTLLDYVLPSRSDPRTAAIAKLTKMFDFSALRKSNLISVTCDARDRDLAQRANQRFIEFFLEHHRTLYRNPGTRSFFSQQTELIESELRRTEDELLRIKNEAGVVSIGDQKRLLLERQSGWERELTQIDVDISGAEAEIAALEQQRRRLPERVTLEETVGHPNLAADNMREQLYLLQMRESELSAKLTDQHFMLQQAREQLNSARRVFDQERSERTQTRAGVNPAYERAELAMLTRQADLDALKARGRVLRPKILQAEQDLKRLNEAEVKIARLERDLTVHQANYSRYVQSLEQSRIDEALDLERISNIGIEQPPVADENPVRPDRPLLLTLIAVAVTFVAVGIGFGIDTLGRPSTATAASTQLSAVSG